MAWIVTTVSHNGRRWYLRLKGGVATDRGRAARYHTFQAAENALVRKRMHSEIDSAWRHGAVVPEDEPLYADRQPNEGPPRLAMLFPGLGSRRIVSK